MSEIALATELRDAPQHDVQARHRVHRHRGQGPRPPLRTDVPHRLHDLWDIQPRRVRLPGDLEFLGGAHPVQARVTSRRTYSHRFDGTARSMSARGGSVAGLGKTRVEGLTDGIFSAVMTILGLSLTVPYITGPPDQPLPDFMTVATAVLIYSLSFVMPGIFWVGPHVGFHYIRRTDRTLIWLNNFFLLCVGLLPLTTALLGRHDLEEVDPRRLRAQSPRRAAPPVHLVLVSDRPPPSRGRGHGRADHTVRQASNPVGTCFSAAAILLSFLDARLSLGVYVLFPIIFILPGRIDRFWPRHE